MGRKVGKRPKCMEVTYDPLTLSNLPTYLKVGLQAYNDHYLHLWNQGDASAFIEENLTEAPVLNALKDARQSLFIIRADGQAVGILKLTDAAPVFETHSPEDASLMLINQLGPRPYMVGALGARSESCMDTSYADNEFSEELIQADPSKINWLNEFVALNQGYNWSICADDRDEEAELLERSVKDYMIMLMEEAQCMVMM